MVDKEYIALAQQMADSAGAILRSAYRRPLAVDHKSDLSPVTIADRNVEIALRAAIEARFPDHGIIGEEFGNVRQQSPYQWVIDPIDGTRSFIAGYPLFTTLIALAFEGTPILGMIDQPISGERWLGVRGKETTLSGNPVKTSGRSALQNAVIATTSMDYFTPTQLQSFLKLKSQCANTVLGGDAYAYAMLASGQIDMVVDGGMKPYDFCALKPVIEGAGGVITDWQGKPITIHSDGRVLAAANEALHKQALAALQ